MGRMYDMGNLSKAVIGEFSSDMTPEQQNFHVSEYRDILYHAVSELIAARDKGLPSISESADKGLTMAVLTIQGASVDEIYGTGGKK